MSRSSPRRTLDAIVTQAIALIAALAASDLKRRHVAKRAQLKASNKSIKLELLASHDL